jgi:hypothetical protein
MTAGNEPQGPEDERLAVYEREREELAAGIPVPEGEQHG